MVRGCSGCCIASCPEDSIDQAKGVGAEIASIFAAHAQWDWCVTHNACRQHLDWDARMGHGRRVADQGFHASKALGQVEEPAPRQEAPVVGIPRSRTLIMPPKSCICGIATAWLGCSGRPG